MVDSLMGSRENRECTPAIQGTHTGPREFVSCDRPLCFQPSISVYMKTYMRDWGLRLHRECMKIYFTPNRIDRKTKWDNAGRCTWHAVSWTTSVKPFHNLPVWTSKTEDLTITASWGCGKCTHDDKVERKVCGILKVMGIPLTLHSSLGNKANISS